MTGPGQSEFKNWEETNQCFGSVLNLIQTPDPEPAYPATVPDSDPGFYKTNSKEKFVGKIKVLFSVSNCYKDID